MSLRMLRKQQMLSQEKLAENTGLSLRTIQRIESGEHASGASESKLAQYFATEIQNLYPAREETSGTRKNTTTLDATSHRSAQIIILFVTYFICISQWLNFYSRNSAVSSEGSLGTILSYVFFLAATFSIVAYVFNRAQRIFVWSYYSITAGFVFTIACLYFWMQPLGDSASAQLFFPIVYSLMLVTLTAVHIVQIALSLPDETRQTAFSL